LCVIGFDVRLDTSSFHVFPSDLRGYFRIAEMASGLGEYEGMYPLV